MKTYLTERGADRLQAAIAAAEQELKKIREEKAVAYTASGDTWHDNPTFNALEQTEKRVATDIAQKRQILASSAKVSVVPRDTTRVALGSIVKYLTVNTLSGDTECAWIEIGGYGESDFDNGLVTYDTPLGRLLMGLEPGGKRQGSVPAGKIEIEVLRLYQSWDDAVKEGASPRSTEF